MSRLLSGLLRFIDSCQNLQIIALHDYNLDTSYVASHVDAAKPLTLKSGKRLLYEEFGANGGNKQSQIQSITNLLISVRHFPELRVDHLYLQIHLKTGVPWMYWEVSGRSSPLVFHFRHVRLGY